MALTTPLGLTKLLPGESLASNQYGFTTGNIDKIDRYLRLLMTHRHNNTFVASPVPGPPDVAETTSEGRLRPGVTYYYRVAEVSEDMELESPAGPSSWVTISAGLTAPTLTNDDITSEATGGTLPPGIYQYAFTVYADFHTYDTDSPGPISVDLSPMLGDEHSVTVSLPPLPSGASGWNVYRRAPGEGEFYLLETLVGGPESFVDDGSMMPSGRILPTRNESAWNRSVTVTKPDDIAGDWVVYRSTRDDDWTASKVASMLASDDSFLDDGSPTTFEAPYDGFLDYQNPSWISHDELMHVPHIVTFTSDGPAGVGPLGEWVCPFEAASVAGLTAYLDQGVTPGSQDLMIALESWNPFTEEWEVATGVAVLAGESQGSTTSITPLGIDPMNGDRLRLNVVQVGDPVAVTVHLKIWGIAGESWAPPTALL